MLAPYWGEFLVSPIPLELSLNYCSHKCAYCFANLNKPDRRFEPNPVMRLLADYRNRDTLEARLLQQGYPVLISNRVDPLAHSNDSQALPIIEVMVELGIPVSIQTKGGRKEAELIDMLPPSVWYISISTLDDDLRSRLEPGAPSIERRFALASELRRRGHRVVLGLNPIVPEWCPDPYALLHRAVDAGFEGVWAESLHLDRKQQAGLSPKERAAIGEEVIARVSKRFDETDATSWRNTRDAAASLGLPFFSVGTAQPSEFFAPYRDVYPKTMPTMQDFVNHAFENFADGDLLTFDDFWEVLAPRMPVGPTASDYVRVVARQVSEFHKVPRKTTWETLARLWWGEPRIRSTPAGRRCFAFAAVLDNQGGFAPLIDEESLPLLAFAPEGTEEWNLLVDVPEGEFTLTE